VAAAVLASAGAIAQYPERALRIVVPLPPGGASDAIARTLGRAVAKSIGQPVVIENKPGASGAIGAQALLAAPADGYTFLWGISSMVALPLLQKNPPYRSLEELAPVAMVGRLAFGMYVHPSVPARSIAELVGYARGNPQKLSYGSATMGEYMAATQFMQAAGVDMLRVPYKGGAQLLPDLVQGRVQVNFGPVSAAQPHVRDGRLRMLATLQPRRDPASPDVPTMAEAGMPAVSVPTWQAIFGPAGLPPQIAERVSGEIRLALRDPELQKKFAGLSFTAEGSTPQELAVAVRSDFQTWQRFVHANGIAPE
jgi:tripartite-type tricarboxylate transporter receptor subunit TctC